MKLINDETKNLDYNQNGSPIETSEYTYEYNTNQRPIKAFKEQKLLAEYSYNSFGERIKKVNYSDGQKAVTYFLYDGNVLTSEIIKKTPKSGGVSFNQYIYLKHQPIAKLEQKQLYAIHSDHLGTPRLTTNDKKATVWKANYSPFGKAEIKSEKITLNLRLPGQYEDTETGTHYNYLRDYNPETGRYITSDPIGLKGGVNTYAYVSGDPIASIDPLGLRQPRVVVRSQPTIQNATSASSVANLIGMIAVFNASFQYNVIGGTGYTNNDVLDLNEILQAYQMIETIQQYDPSFSPPKPSQSNINLDIYQNLELRLEAAVRINLLQKKQIGFRYDPLSGNLYSELDILQLDRALEADSNGQCLALPKHVFMDLSTLEQFLLNEKIYISPEGQPYPNELQYQVEKQNYDNYRYNGGTRTFLDWKANLGNDRSDLYKYDEYLENGGRSTYEEWAKSNGSYWSPKTVDNRRVYQRNDIDPELVGPEGVSNLDRMKNGQPPYVLGSDGNYVKIELHHMIQTESLTDGGQAPLAEVPADFHDRYYDQIHIYPRNDPDYTSWRKNNPEDAVRYDNYRRRYWRTRAKDF